MLGAVGGILSGQFIWEQSQKIGQQSMQINTVGAEWH